jgi:hypothetical protein
MRTALLLSLLLSACDQLFPPPPDLGAMDLASDGAAGRATGQVCVLAELRDYRLCSLTHRHGPITVSPAEGGAEVLTDQEGRFSLDLPPGPAAASLLARDPARQLQAALVQVPRSASASVIPMVPTDRLALLMALGVTLDPARGAVLAYVVDGSGQPLRGVLAQVMTGGTYAGPFFESGLEALEPGGRTGPGGLVAVFDLVPGMATLSLSGPRQDRYVLPVAAGAVTFSLLR